MRLAEESRICRPNMEKDSKSPANRGLSEITKRPQADGICMSIRQNGRSFSFEERTFSSTRSFPCSSLNEKSASGLRMVQTQIIVLTSKPRRSCRGGARKLVRPIVRLPYHRPQSDGVTPSPLPLEQRQRDRSDNHSRLVTWHRSRLDIASH